MDGAVSGGQLKPLVHRLLPTIPASTPSPVELTTLPSSRAHHRLEVRGESNAPETKIAVPHVGVLIPLVGRSVGRDVSQVCCDADVRDTGHIAEITKVKNFISSCTGSRSMRSKTTLTKSRYTSTREPTSPPQERRSRLRSCQTPIQRKVTTIVVFSVWNRDCCWVRLIDVWLAWRGRWQRWTWMTLGRGY
jgi:hypothetical protein